MGAVVGSSESVLCHFVTVFGREILRLSLLCHVRLCGVFKLVSCPFTSVLGLSIVF
ncbi:hypothetical protein [Vibrio sp. SCSIO 43136]|uniref:hypothetical protein n=1 Tax=Vibrio sp. SCSIO 43136 TaxID=2819101 RepID=UPI002074CE86|nr:hypothetical protein [Vibrio sp. SCSIO 43136]USD64106.1 hypothetical protein J4N39_08230 [Vibrio sp. SCSIO 43136]USD66853.1 hypothetical protein J4N39_19570 [Vibrio sp. SCSIO 43136]